MTCIIYLHTNQTVEKVTAEVATVLELSDARSISPTVLDTPDLYISVRHNELAEAGDASAFPDGFLHFPIYVELSTPDDIDETQMAPAVERLLQHFWDDSIPAVAECGFDDLLALGGGYNQTALPWPRD